MSNRSYEKVVELATKPNVGIFQFPVGMSNRSYLLISNLGKRELQAYSFNSPWECRIGLTGVF